MKMLANFLAEHLLDRKNFDNYEWPLMIKDYTELIADAIEAYKEHLKTDEPKTVQWAMIENQLILALDKMQGGHNHCEEIYSGVEHLCAYPEYRMNMGCEGCPCEKVCDAKPLKCGDCGQFSEEGNGCLQGTRKITKDSKACKNFYKEN